MVQEVQSLTDTKSQIPDQEPILEETKESLGNESLNLVALVPLNSRIKSASHLYFINRCLTVHHNIPYPSLIGIESDLKTSALTLSYNFPSSHLELVDVTAHLQQTAYGLDEALIVVVTQVLDLAIMLLDSPIQPLHELPRFIAIIHRSVQKK